MIHLRDVSKSYTRGEQTVLACAVDRLDVEAGEQVALIGRSGTGKTTLLHILAGILRADCGHIEVVGGRLDQLQEVRHRVRHEVAVQTDLDAAPRRGLRAQTARPAQRPVRADDRRTRADVQEHAMGDPGGPRGLDGAGRSRGRREKRGARDQGGASAQHARVVGGVGVDVSRLDARLASRGASGAARDGRASVDAASPQRTGRGRR